MLSYYYYYYYYYYYSLPGALETLRIGPLKLKYRSGGPCTDCNGRAAPQHALAVAVYRSPF